MKKNYSVVPYLIKIICSALLVSFVFLIIYKYIIKDNMFINSELKDDIITNFYKNKEYIDESIKKNDPYEIKKIKEVEDIADMSDEDYKYIKIIYYYEGSFSEYNMCGIIYSTYNDTDLFLDELISEYKKIPSGKGVKYIDMVSDDDLYIENLEGNYYYFQQDY